MRKKLFILGCFLASTIEGISQSDQTNSAGTPDTTVTGLKEVVVTGTRFELPIEKSGKIIYKLSAEDIEKNAGKSIPDILNEVPGIQMSGNFGTLGTNIDVYARGGRSKNTLILIDGIPLNDPSGINASYDLRLLSLNQVESIEVLKGALSTLYGTGASAAVINIKLKEAVCDESGGQIAFNYGSFDTFNGSASLQGGAQKLSCFVSGKYQISEGFSAASDERSGILFDDDGFEKKNGLLKLGYKFNDAFHLGSILAYDEFETDYDGGAFSDAPNVQTGDMFRAGVIPSFSYEKGEVKLKAMYAVNNRELESSLPTASEGKNLQLDLSQKHQLSGTLTGFWGINAQNFAYDERASVDFDDTRFTLIDPYASLFFENNSGLNIHAGVRLNRHTEYGSQFVYNLNPGYLFSVADNLSVKLLASVATGYITPTGFQLFSPGGNADLDAEKSLNLEFGGSLYLDDGFTLNLVYFTREETNAIDFVGEFDAEGEFTGGSYENNSGMRDVKGFETDLTFSVTEELSFSANYAYVTTDDITTFYQIPKNKYGAMVNYAPFEQTSLSLKYNYTGKRTIFDFYTASEVNLGSYGLFDLYVQQKFQKTKLAVYGAVNNLANEDFVAIYGYTTRGRTCTIGLNYNF